MIKINTIISADENGTNPVITMDLVEYYSGARPLHKTVSAALDMALTWARDLGAIAYIRNKGVLEAVIDERPIPPERLEERDDILFNPISPAITM